MVGAVKLSNRMVVKLRFMGSISAIYDGSDQPDVPRRRLKGDEVTRFYRPPHASSRGYPPETVFQTFGLQVRAHRLRPPRPPVR